MFLFKHPYVVREDTYFVDRVGRTTVVGCELAILYFSLACCLFSMYLMQIQFVFRLQNGLVIQAICALKLKVSNAHTLTTKNSSQRSHFLYSVL